VVAPHYQELPGLELLTPPEEFPEAPEVVVTFDCGSLQRLGDLAGPAKAAGELVVLDHHASNDRFGTINVVEPQAAATAVLVYHLIHEMGLPLNREAAVCLYAGIVCDTGRFQYDSTSQEVFDIARDLLGYDVPLARLNRSLFEEHRFTYLQMVGTLLGRARLVTEKRFVWVAVTQDDLSRYGVTIEETEGLIDLVRRTSEAEVSCVLKEDADGSVRVSLRSLGDVDVCRIAQDNGGGGHRFAAGFTSSSGVDDVVARIEAALPSVA
jgi:phosphoesterase RecJ-like protein